MESKTLDSFNAKYLDSDDFKRTFVPSSSFDKVAKNAPVLVVGARGSGKTTLLKMLSNDILPFWEHENSDSYRKSIKLEGIYVPADSVWGDRIRALRKSGCCEHASELFASTVFSTNVYLCTIDAISRSLNIDVQENLQVDKNLSDRLKKSIKSIADYLQLDIDSHSLTSIKHSLRKRMNFLGEYAKKTAIKGGLTIESLEKDIPFIYMELDSTLESILDCYDEVFSRQGLRWAVLLDEFEVAPEALQKDIIRKLRSQSKKHLYKIALVPCGRHLDSNHIVSAKNDYEVLQLWSRSFEQNKAFCRDILQSRFNISDPESIFGESDFVEVNKIDPQLLGSSFQELYEKDQEFRKYIDRKGFIIGELYTDSPKVDELRKIGPEVIFRNFFKNSKGSIKRRDTLDDFYSGWNAIVKISEGNPRWIMATISSLVDHIKSSGKKTISKSIQAREIKLTTNAFKSMIATTALEDNMGITTKTAPIVLIEKLVDYIKDQNLGTDFKANPYGKFEIDRNVNEDFRSALRIAFNHGAIIALDQPQGNDIWSLRDLENKTFRLSYLLSAAYSLPLRHGKKVKLSLALSAGSEIPGMELIRKKPNQGDLFL
jgi:energy-coupling factor transporter ATP-binding protein EcfA2|tara:strand:- start:158 stop:1957 length:1800 start_codon:yes stop_codon:yes gene_type:complete